MGGDTTTGGRLRGLAIPGLTVAALTIAQGGPGITALGPVRRPLFRGLAGYGDPGHVALTFDDGPDPGRRRASWTCSHGGTSARRSSCWALWWRRHRGWPPRSPRPGTRSLCTAGTTVT
jgi:hypothetical protein